MYLDYEILNQLPDWPCDWSPVWEDWIQSPETEIEIEIRNSSKVEKIIVYPTLSQEILNLKSNLKINSVEIFSLDGNKVHHSLHDSFEIKINTYNFESGLYLIKILTPEGSTIKKFIKI